MIEFSEENLEPIRVVQGFGDELVPDEVHQVAALALHDQGLVVRENQEKHLHEDLEVEEQENVQHARSVFQLDYVCAEGPEEAVEIDGDVEVLEGDVFVELRVFLLDHYFQNLQNFAHFLHVLKVILQSLLVHDREEDPKAVFLLVQQVAQVVLGQVHQDGGNDEVHSLEVAHFWLQKDVVQKDVLHRLSE